MIRTITEADIPAITRVATECGLFTEEQLALVHEMLSSALKDMRSGAPFWLVHAKTTVDAIAYVEPERMTEGTWNIQLIAVAPESQRSGIGRRLLAGVEQRLRDCGARVVLVETSGTSDFDHVRAFYASSGFSEEARIREFYAAGVDKVTYRKSLS